MHYRQRELNLLSPPPVLDIHPFPWPRSSLVIRPASCHTSCILSYVPLLAALPRFFLQLRSHDLAYSAPSCLVRFWIRRCIDRTGILPIRLWPQRASAMSSLLLFDKTDLDVMIVVPEASQECPDSTRRAA